MGTLGEVGVYRVDKNKDISGLTMHDLDAVKELFQRFGICPTRDIYFINVEVDGVLNIGDLYAHSRFIRVYSDPKVSAFGIYLDRGSCMYEHDELRCLIICNSCMRFTGFISDARTIRLKNTLFEKEPSAFFDRDFLKTCAEDLSKYFFHEMGISDTYMYHQPGWLKDTPEPQGVYFTKTSTELTEEEKNYMLNDILVTRDLASLSFAFNDTVFIKVKPVKVIFNNPATIVIWNDGTKTIVKKQKGDRYDKEKGLALCYMKKALGNTSRKLNDALRKGLDE